MGTTAAVSLGHWPTHRDRWCSKLCLLKKYLEDEYAGIAMELYHGMEGSCLSVAMTTSGPRLTHTCD